MNIYMENSSLNNLRIKSGCYRKCSIYMKYFQELKTGAASEEVSCGTGAGDKTFIF